MDKPKVVQKKPFETEIKANRIYWWCACGLSEKQPFCDGSHKGTGIKPVQYQTDKLETVNFCGCKNTKNSPFCDGSHLNLIN